MSQYNKRREESDSDSEDDANFDDSEYFDSSDDDDDDDEHPLDFPSDPSLVAATLNTDVKWVDVPSDFIPRKTIPSIHEPVISHLDENCNEIQAFLAVFPKSLFMWISKCTNERLVLYAEKERKVIPPTDHSEIMLIIGITLMMSYNRVPRMAMYWSRDSSLRNEAIASAIARDRFKLLVSKLYFNSPKKPVSAGKTYYMDELLNCLKYTFNRIRSESSRQSIDEAMVKFEGRCAMKQFMKDKPVDRGIKGWVRADANKGYVYDFIIYTGKQTLKEEGTLGERVVNALSSTIREPEVTLTFDRFFTSVHLLKTSRFPCFGTVMTNRKNLPKMPEKLKRGDSKAMCAVSDGIICYKWQDTKEVTLLTNCHNHVMETADRRQKDGTIKTFDCPQAIVFYNRFMGGVDKADQYSTTYEVDRKSNKWWKRVFHRLLMIAVSNSWIVFKEVKKEDVPLLDFLIPLATAVTKVGKSGAKLQRAANTGRPSKRAKLFINVGHQPIEGPTMRRCRFCATKKIQSRTKWMCNTCDEPLCVRCFALYHK